MSLTKAIIRIALVVCTLLGSHAAMAGPVRCSVNNQDSTCVGQITTGWQTAPTCPSTPGYTTVAAAQWIGSQYSAPTCNYQAPPSCPSGYDQAGPDWNGSNWVNLICTPRTPPTLVLVSAVGFWAWADCVSYNGGGRSGPVPVAIYKDTWSDGSTTYYQGSSQGANQEFKVLVDSQGRYYVAIVGDNWDKLDSNGNQMASLYEWGATDSSVPIPKQPAYRCQ